MYGAFKDVHTDRVGGSHLDLGRMPYVLYGVQYIDVVSLAPPLQASGLLRGATARCMAQTRLSFGSEGASQNPGSAKRDAALKEFGASERGYVSYLQIIMDKFMHPFNNLKETSIADQRLLFAHIPDLLTIHSKMATEVEVELGKPSGGNVGAVSGF